MRKHSFAVVLQKVLPPELVSLMDGYLHNEGGLLYLHCSSIEHFGNFVFVSVVKGNEDLAPWPVQIPVCFVIAIADMSVPHAGPGFLSLAQ